MHKKCDNMSEKQESRMMTRLPNELHKAARIKAIEENEHLSEIVRRLLQAWVAGEIPTPLAQLNENED